MSAVRAPQTNPQTGMSWARVASGKNVQQLESNKNPWPQILPSPTQQIGEQQGRIDNLESEVKQMRCQLEDEARKAGEHSSERHRLETKLSKTEKDLNNARKMLLDLQPPQDVSDDQVKRAFEDLCQNIEDWVDIECSYLVGLDQRFNNEHWTWLESRLVEQHISDDDIRLSVKLPKICSNIVMHAIFSFMYGQCLREERWCLWIDPSKESFINDLIEELSKSKQFRNSSIQPEHYTGLKFSNNSKLRRWRSETFQALRSGKQAAARRKAGMKEVAKELGYVLKHFVDKGSDINVWRLHDKIVEPSFALADLIKTTTSGYRFDFVVNSSTPSFPLDASETCKYRLVDARSGIEIDETFDVTGEIGNLRLCIFPALQKVQDDGERSCLSKSMVVFERASGPAADFERTGLGKGKVDNMKVEKSVNSSIRTVAEDAAGRTIRTPGMLGEVATDTTELSASGQEQITGKMRHENAISRDRGDRHGQPDIFW